MNSGPNEMVTCTYINGVMDEKKEVGGMYRIHLRHCSFEPRSLKSVPK